MYILSPLSSEHCHLCERQLRVTEAAGRPETASRIQRSGMLPPEQYNRPSASFLHDRLMRLLARRCRVQLTRFAPSDEAARRPAVSSKPLIDWPGGGPPRYLRIIVRHPRLTVALIWQFSRRITRAIEPPDWTVFDSSLVCTCRRNIIQSEPSMDSLSATRRISAGGSSS